MSPAVARPFESRAEERSEKLSSAVTLPWIESERGDHLTRILSQRRRPLLLVIDSDGELLFSSVPESAPASDHRLLGQALAEARSLFQWQTTVEGPGEDAQRSVIDRQGQRSVLACFGNQFYSLRVITLHGFGDDPDGEQFAALVEPIVEGLTKDVDFGLIKQKYRLSTRECDVLEALMNGAKDKDIARTVGLTTGTVRSYLKSIRGKLGVSTRTAIVNLVHEFGTAAQSHGNPPRPWRNRTGQITAPPHSTEHGTMGSRSKNGSRNGREPIDEAPTDELKALDVTAAPVSQSAELPDASGADPNLLALRRVDAEIRRVMESWVELESQLENRDVQITRLRDHGRSVDQEVQETRNELTSTRSDFERLRAEVEVQRSETQAQHRLQQEYRRQSETLQLELAAAHGRIGDLEGQLGQGKAVRDRLETQLAEHRDALTGMATELRAFEKAHNGQDHDKAALAARIADIERRGAEWTGHRRELEEKLLTTSRQAEGLEAELRKSREKAAQLETALEQQTPLATRLNELQRELGVERDGSLTLRKQLKASTNALGQAETALERQQQKTEAARNSASHTEQLLTENRGRLAAFAALEARVAELGDALAAAEAAAVAAAGERERLLVIAAGLREQVSVLNAERSQLIAQRDEQQALALSVDSEFSAKRRSVAALGRELDRLGLIQANVRKLDGMMTRQLASERVTDGEPERPHNVRLIVSLDGNKALKYPLFKSDMLIGRSRNTDIRVAGPHTSRRHARVFIEGGAVMIEDLGSLNGITVNNKRVRRHVLHDGDVLDVGGAKLRFVDLDEKASAPRKEMAGRG